MSQPRSTWTFIAASVVALAACGRDSGGTSPASQPSATAQPSPPASAATASAAASGSAIPADPRSPVTDFDVSGDSVGHVHLVGPLDGRLDAKHMFTFTLSHVNEETDASGRQVLSLQGGVDTSVGKTVQIPGHLMFDNNVYAGDCSMVIDNQGPIGGPNRTRRLEGTFSCPEMKGGAKKTVKISSGHFGGNFEDHR